jgi:large subunit ribosomal protein L23
MSYKRGEKILTDAYAILRRPIMTEKAHSISSAEGNPKHVFEVHVKATKEQIKSAVQEAFGVKVEAVNVMIVKPRTTPARRGKKPGMTRIRKKAVITLTKDSKKIELV